MDPGGGGWGGGGANKREEMVAGGVVRAGRGRQNDKEADTERRDVLYIY